MKNTKIFYGWIIVASSFLIMTLGWGIVFNTSSLFIEPVSETLDISRKVMNFTFTLRAIFQLLISLSSVILFKRFKMINVMRFCSVGLGITFFLHSYINSVFLLYLLNSLSTVFVILLSVLPLSAILNNWFHIKRGLVVGISFMGSGIGGLIFNPITGYIIVNYGWRSAYQFLSVVIFAIVVPITFFVLKQKPEDIGENPLGEIDEEESEKSEDKSYGITLSEAMRTFRFWGISVASVLLSIVGISLMLNISPHLTNAGYSVTFAANIVALTMGALAIGKIILGSLFDKLGLRTATSIAVSFLIIGTVGMIYVTNYIALFAVVAGTGLGTAFYTIANPIITTKVYGNKDYSSIYGFLTAVIGLGGIISPLIVGFLYDSSGSYFSSYKLMLVLGIAVLVLYQFVFPKEEEQYD
ncbi:MAG: MFS transporter [Tissierellales bacterium]|jgi:MFS family permease|nr:MFS transporter [Tissierellales bacterium]